MAAAFSYEPLPARCIRVIDLLPARRPTDALRCSIKHVDLDDRVAAPPYEALSYVWGEPTRQWPLDCSGKELLVTKNCHEALVNLRSRFLPRTLWIDAICINQAGTDEATTERNGQVAMMGEIYLKATRVLIWMGPPGASVPTLFRYLRSLHFFEEDKSSRLLETLTGILNNSWFERVWTLQEVAFGRKCLV
ncbi:hypothetical protein N658DRAFT_430897, partial [Parathielavia hyrcaniae]